MNCNNEDLYNESYHVADWCSEHQVIRDCVRRLNRDRDSKSNCHRTDNWYKGDDHYRGEFLPA